MTPQTQLITEPEEIEQIYEFIKRFQYDYPDYLIWVEQCFRELQLGYKKAFVYKINNEIIASLIFQQHKTEPKILEMKNARVKPRYRRRKIFTSLYDAVEKYAKEKGFKRITCDTHKDNLPVIQTLKSLGFTIEAEETLYTRKRLESILSKNLV